MNVKSLILILSAAFLICGCASKREAPPPREEAREELPAWRAPIPDNDTLALMAQDAWADLFRNPEASAGSMPSMAFAAVRLVQGGGVEYPQDMGHRIEKALYPVADRSFTVRSEAWLHETLAQAGFNTRQLPAAYHRSAANDLRSAVQKSGRSLDNILLITMEGIGDPGRGDAEHTLSLELIKIDDAYKRVRRGRSVRVAQ